MSLSAERASIFRITHINNVEWDLEHGLRCRSSPQKNPKFRDIGSLGLIERRKDRTVPIAPGGTLSDYVPFYFTSRSPMLYNIKTGYNGITKVPMSELVIYGASLRSIAADGLEFVFTDRHAKLEMAVFSNALQDLDNIDWKVLNASDFKYDPNDPGKMDRYQAEALIHDSVRCANLAAIICYSESTKSIVEIAAKRLGVEIQILVKPGMFFG